jgi:CHAT domain
MTYELQVHVSNRKATATLTSNSVRDADRGTADIRNDRLTTETVRLLQQWLSRWQIVSKIGSTYDESFPVLDTFRVLGEHLYQMVFAGAVGEGFRRSYQDAQAAGQDLRVMLSFAPDSAELAAYPWEFLYWHNDAGRSFYLATETDLVLNRFLPGGRRSIRPATPPLRVLFIMCVPRSYDPDQEEHMRQRQEVLASMRNLKERSERSDAEEGLKRLDIRIVDDWDSDRVEDELKWDPHVVHIVGHARYALDTVGGRMRGEIELPGGEGGRRWNDPQPVVDLLTRGKSEEELPRLVILHLCEMKPVDFTASFERLAPGLIEAGMPAVLAMQYPMSADAASKFTSIFYTRLAGGEEVDKLVQDIRYKISKEPGNSRLIGTPVLYMQSLGGRLIAEETEIPSEGKVDPHHVSTRAVVGGGRGVEVRLKAAARSVANSQQPQLLKDLESWIEDTGWSDDTAANVQQIRQQIRLDPYVRERGPMYLAMIEELAGGGDDLSG